jgi:APA family basic amino acid/polyamine antiporter
VLMMLVSSSRIMYGMSKDDALFNPFSKIHDKTKTPWLAILVSALMSITVIIIFSNEIPAVSKIDVFGILQYLYLSISHIY